MPSNRHESLYVQLYEVTNRVKAAMGNKNYHALPPMLAVHQDLMRQLAETGDCDDPKMLTLLNNIRQEVNRVIQALEWRKKELREKIRVSGNKRKLARAYGQHNSRQSTVFGRQVTENHYSSANTPDMTMLRKAR